MGILSRLKRFVFQDGFEDEMLDDQVVEDEAEIFEDENVTSISSRRHARPVNSRNDTIALPSRAAATRASFTGERDVYTMPGVSVPFQIVHAHPESIDSASAVCDLLKQNKAVIVDMESTDAKEGQRIMDFISGVTYAMKGDIYQVSERIFVVHPDGVEVTDQHKEQLRASGIFGGLSLKAVGGR